MPDALASLLTPDNLAALATLTAMEVVLGIDNLVFLTILTGKVAPEHRRRVRLLGLGLAVGMRIALLMGISWVMKLTAPLFTLPPLPLLSHSEDGTPISGKALILLLGGLFLIGKATWEIHHQTEGPGADGGGPASAGKKIAHASVGMIVAQIVMLDLVFSLDSVITAVGMVKDSIAIMVVAVLIAVGCMLAFAEPLGRFVERHPSIKMLALAFLVLIGVMLVAEGILPEERHMPKGYIYTAMAFSLGVELLNLRANARRKAA
ncbi:MAG: TerC family protein [Phycisphaerales bacterium]